MPREPLNHHLSCPFPSLQDDITKVMEHFYDHVPEIGGRAAEAKAIRHAYRLKSVLLEAAFAFRFQSTVMMIVTRMLVLATSVLTLVVSHLRNEGKTSKSTLNVLQATLVCK